MTVTSIVTPSLLIAAILAGPTVDLVTSDLEEPLSSSAVRGQLLDRLLEAGHPLRRDASIRVVLETRGDAVAIMLARHGEQWEDAVDLAGRPPEVVALDVAQRVVAMLAEHGGQPNEAIDDGVRLDPQIGDAATRSALLSALVDAEFAVVPVGDAAAWTACAASSGDGLEVAFVASADECPAALMQAEPTSDATAGVDAAAARAGLGGVEEPEPEAPPADPLPDEDFRPRREAPKPMEPEAEPSLEPPVVSSEPLEISVFADVGLSARPDVGGRYGASLLLGRQRGPTGLFELAFLPTRGANDLRVLDVPMGVGFAWRVALSPKWRLIPAAALGIRLHNPRFGSDAVGTRVDPHVAVPIRVHWLPSKRLRLGLRLAGAFDGRRREHRVNGTQAWVRSAWRFDAGVVLGVALGRG